MRAVTRKICWVAVCLLMMVGRVGAEDVTIDGQLYKNVRWGTYTATTITMFYSGGKMEVYYRSLPPELQKRFHFVDTTSSPSANKAAPTSNRKAVKLGDIIEVKFNWVEDCHPVGNGLYKAKLRSKDQSSTTVEYDESGKETMERWLKDAAVWQRYVTDYNNWRRNPTRQEYDTYYQKMVTVKLPEPKVPRGGERLVYAKVQLVVGEGGVPGLLLVGSTQFVGMLGKTSYKW